CPCGYYGTADARCACTPREVRRYRGKLSGPLLDRFDLTVQVRAVELSTLTASGREEPTAVVRVRVVAARGIQRRRFARGVVTCNARMGPTDLERFTRVGDDTRTMMLAAADRLRLSARGFDRVRRVARTIADLAGAETIASDHVAEALQYRQVDPVQL
ncbi:MAG: ATP-binding protein, partial [bacterium]|nr:ATP-binding protein [bacterium]